MRAIQVAIVGPSLRYVGGQSVQAAELLAKWDGDEAVKTNFIAIDPELPRIFRWVERLPVLRTLIRFPFYLSKLWQGVASAEVVHIFSASYWSFLLAPLPAFLISRIRGKSTLLNYHSGEARDHLSRSRFAIHILQSTDLNVTPSAYLADVFKDFHVTAEVIPNIVDSKQFTFRLRRPVSPRFICTRGFHSYYSIDLVVRAFAEVQKQYPESKLVLLGKGSLENEIRNLVSTLKLRGVEFRGAVPHAKVPQAYTDADIFINASHLDNMPISILEAFASGTPVVSTAPEGIRYLVEHERTGLLCDPGDWRALASNCLRVLQDQELSERLSLSAQDELGRYEWPSVRSQWLNAYKSLAQRTIN
jgi:L-malate glycosyltransferase